MVDHSREITQLLQEARLGDPKAINHLDEAYLRLLYPTHADANNRTHFFALASRAMRFVLIDYARRRTTQTCGSPGENVPLDAVTVAVEDGIKMRGIDPFPARPASDRYSI